MGTCTLGNEHMYKTLQQHMIFYKHAIERIGFVGMVDPDQCDAVLEVCNLEYRLLSHLNLLNNIIKIREYNLALILLLQKKSL